MDGKCMQKNVRKIKPKFSQEIKKLKEMLRRCKEIVVDLLLEMWNDEF